jgi:hypothetical protein
MGVRSPSTEFDYLGRMTMHGYAQGLEAGAPRAFGSMGGVLSAAQDMASKNAAGYDGSNGVTVSVKKPASYDEYQDAVAAQQAAARKAQFRH